MKLCNLLVMSIMLIFSFSGCSSSTEVDSDAIKDSEVDAVTGATFSGSLDTNNVGIGLMITPENIDTFLEVLFSQYKPGNGLDIFYMGKEVPLDLQNSVVAEDSTIVVDSTCDGSTGFSLCSAKGTIDYQEVKEQSKVTSTTVSVKETFYNYSIDNTLFIGGQLLSTEEKVDTTYKNCGITLWSQEKTETYDLTIVFNGAYKGQLKGLVTYYIHDNSTTVLDSVRIATFSIRSGNQIIEIEKDRLEKYLR